MKYEIDKGIEARKILGEIQGAMRDIADKRYFIGCRLLKIKERELYREIGFKSWSAFCADQLEFSKRYADKLIEDEQMRQALTEMDGGKSGNSVPNFERSVPKIKEKEEKSQPQPKREESAETEKTEPKEVKPCAAQTASVPIRDSAPATPIDAPSNAPIAVQPGDGAHTQIEFSFACQIVAPEDDAIWFQNLTPIERGQAIARARQQP